MTKSRLIWLSIWVAVLIIMVVLMEANAPEHPKELWGTAISPQQDWTLQLYQKPNSFHQAPDIIIVQKDDNDVQTTIDVIPINASDESALSYTIEWLSDKRAEIIIECHPCMDEQLHYVVRLGDNPESVRIQHDLIPTFSFPNT